MGMRNAELLPWAPSLRPNNCQHEEDASLRWRKVEDATLHSQGHGVLRAVVAEWVPWPTVRSRRR